LKIPSTGKRGSFPKKKVGTRAGGFILKCKNLTIRTRVVYLFEFPKYGQFQLFSGISEIQNHWFQFFEKIRIK